MSQDQHLYSRNGDYPDVLPLEAIDPETGRTYTSLDLPANADSLALLGFVAVDDPPDVPDDKVLGWANGAWTLTDAPPPPPPYVPQEISNLQARLELDNTGLLSTVQTAVNAAGGAVAIYFNYASSFHRDHPSLEAMRVALGWSDDQMDAYFTSAALLT